VCLTCSRGVLTILDSNPYLSNGTRQGAWDVSPTCQHTGEHGSRLCSSMGFVPNMQQWDGLPVHSSWEWKSVGSGSVCGNSRSMLIASGCGKGKDVKQGDRTRGCTQHVPGATNSGSCDGQPVIMHAC
jgi:hypothetical protein